jgi:uncharacterized protein YpiB (UPF0302 family)
LKTVKVNKKRRIKDYALEKRISSCVRTSLSSTHSEKLPALHFVQKIKHCTTELRVLDVNEQEFVPVRKVAAAVKTERAGTRMRKKRLKTTQVY